jgi:hypothetical protein
MVGTLVHLCEQPCESWFKLKLVPVDLHLFCVLLFDFNSAVFAVLCCLFSTMVGLQSKLEVGEGVGAQAGPCMHGCIHHLAHLLPADHSSSSSPLPPSFCAEKTSLRSRG